MSELEKRVRGKQGCIIRAPPNRQGLREKVREVGCIPLCRIGQQGQNVFRPVGLMIQRYQQAKTFGLRRTRVCALSGSGAVTSASVRTCSASPNRPRWISSAASRFKRSARRCCSRGCVLMVAASRIARTPSSISSFRSNTSPSNQSHRRIVVLGPVPIHRGQFLDAAWLGIDLLMKNFNATIDLIGSQVGAMKLA